MTDSTHELVAANKQRIWEICRIAGSNRDDTAASPGAAPSAADQYARRLWAN